MKKDNHQLALLIDQAVYEMATAFSKKLNLLIKRMNKTHTAQKFAVPRKPFENLIRRYRKYEE